MTPYAMRKSIILILLSVSLFVSTIFFTAKCNASDNIQKHELAKILSSHNLNERVSQLMLLHNSATEEQAFLLLPNIIKTFVKINDYENARIYSEKLFKLSVKFKENWAYGDAIHDANMVLGLVSLHKGDTGVAEEYLLNAGETPGSYQISNVGPNMMLADALVRQGKVESVLLYLRKIEKIWTQRNDILKHWIIQLQNGDTPDFEDNLDL